MAGSATILFATVSHGPAQALVRPAIPVDALVLATLDSKVNPSPWTRGQFAAACCAQTEGREYALVIDCDGLPAGFVVYSCILDEACIHNIAVHPARQGNGHGRQLLCAALREAHRVGSRRCYLEVRASNCAAIALYEKLGFQLDGRRKNYYPTTTGREDALLMSRLLDAGVLNERA